jgi:molybdopterin synthase sulfur carrier subunit
MERAPAQGNAAETSVSSTNQTARPMDQAGSVVVTVRYWAAIKAAAATGHDEVSGETVADVLAAVRVLHADNPRFAQVLGVCSLLLGDRPLGSADLSQVNVHPGDVIEVLPPFAGG